MAFYGSIKMQNEGETGSLFSVISQKTRTSIMCLCFTLPLSRDINYPQTAQLGDRAVSYHVECRTVKA